MRVVSLISKNTVCELIHRRVHYILGAACLLLLTNTYPWWRRLFLDEVSAEQTNMALYRAIDGMFSLSSFVVVLLGVFLGSTTIAFDKRCKGFLMLFSRPVHTWQFFLGKWLGILITLGSLLLVAYGVALLLMLFGGKPITSFFIITALQILVKLMVASGVAIAFGTLLSPVAAGMLTLIFLYAERFSGAFEHLSSSIGKFVDTLAYYLSPATITKDLLRHYFLGSKATHNLELYYAALLDNLLYAAVFLFLGIIVFDARDKPL